MHISPRWILPAILVLSLLTAGCTSPQISIPGIPTAPPGATPLPLTPSPQASCSITPGPFQTLPAYEDVSITVDRNTIVENPTITTRFDGGLGNGMVQRMTVTVVRSDCITESQFRDNPKVGTSITLMGTTKTDRVIVVLVMTSGDQFTVIDKDYPFPIRMG
jgi:hypothetical protein